MTAFTRSGAVAIDRAVVRETRAAAKRLIADYAFTAFCLLALGLGVGLASSSYAVIAGLLRPVPFAEGILNLYHLDPVTNPGYSRASYAFSLDDYRDLRAHQTTMEAVAGWASARNVRATVRGATVSVCAEAVDSDYFRLFGVAPVIGRLLDARDANDAKVVVISEEFWARHFDRSPSAVGSTVILNGEPVLVVGVVPGRFKGVEMPALLSTSLWGPLSSGALVLGLEREQLIGRDRRWLFVKARAAVGRSINNVSGDLGSIADALDRTSPLAAVGRESAASRAGRRWSVRPADSIRIHESVHRAAAFVSVLLLSVVVLILLVVSTNLATLMYARGIGHSAALVTKLRLGATPQRLFREELTDAVLIALGGALVAYGVFTALTTYMATRSLVTISGLAIVVTPRVDWTVFVAMITASTICVMTFAVGPATSVIYAIVQAGPMSSAEDLLTLPSRRFALLASQVAVSGLLAAGALFTLDQARQRVSALPQVGFDTLTVVQLDASRLRPGQEGVDVETASAVAKITAMPGVASAALTSSVPGLTPSMRAILNPRESTDPHAPITVVNVVQTDGALIEVMRMRRLEGRIFGPRDVVSSRPVAVLNEHLARQVFGDLDAVGRSLTLQFLAPDTAPETLRTVTVLGVVRDPDSSIGTVYLPLTDLAEKRLSLVARTHLPPTSATVEEIRSALTANGLEKAMREIVVGSNLIDPAIQVLEAVSRWAAGLAFVALGIACIGIYGVTSQLVRLRRRDIAVRIALGARSWHVVKFVLREGIRPVLYGLPAAAILGWLLALAARPVFERPASSMSAVGATAIAVLYIVAAALAAAVPAGRAIATDPAQTLHRE